MSGDAEIVTEVLEDAILLPETALRYQGERIFVEALPAGSSDAVERDVEIGIVDGSQVQVLRGLAEGDVVRVR
jgi:HlyD family secretion protein